MGVYLIDVHLTGVHLMGVHLTGVHLMGVYLIGVYLMGAHLMGVYLKWLIDGRRQDGSSFSVSDKNWLSAQFDRPPLTPDTLIANLKRFRCETSPNGTAMNRIPYLASEHGPSPKQKEEKFEVHVQGYLRKGACV